MFPMSSLGLHCILSLYFDLWWCPICVIWLGEQVKLGWSSIVKPRGRLGTANRLLVCLASGGFFGQLAQAPVQSNQLINTASALSAPTLLGDERDAIFAKWNQLQAFWGTGKGYFNNSIPPVDFTQENPFCRFKVRFLKDRLAVLEGAVWPPCLLNPLPLFLWTPASALYYWC